MFRFNRTRTTLCPESNSPRTKALNTEEIEQMQLFLEAIVALSALALALMGLVIWSSIMRKAQVRVNSKWAARQRKIQAEWSRDENERLAYLLGHDRQEVYQER